VLPAVVILHPHPGTEIGLAGVRRWTVDDGQQLQPLAQVAYPPVDLTQALLAVDVFSILGAIAQRRRIADLLGDSWALLSPQIIEFFPQALLASGGDVVGNFASLCMFFPRPAS